MKRAILFSLLILPVLSARPNDDWWHEDRETIHKSFHVAAGENVSKLISDQINGPIHVTGGSGSEIQITWKSAFAPKANRTWTTPSATSSSR
jgi:hypothetical protein